MKVDELLFEAINKHGFRFWSCPKGCATLVEWNLEKATCSECGASNRDITKTNDGVKV